MKSGLKMECHLSGRIADKNIADVVPVSRAVGRSGPGIPAARLDFCRWQKRGAFSMKID